MNTPDAHQAFIHLAEDLFFNRKTDRELGDHILDLPPLTITLLKLLGARVEEVSIRQPRYGWALAKVIHLASIAQNQDLYIQSLSGWYLCRACNHWGQPKLVKSIIAQARKGFLKLNEMGWVAACDWQFYVLSWTRPNIPLAVSTLQNALQGLQQAGLDEFVPHCRMALTYAQLLIGRFDEAQQNIQICEAIFAKAGDRLNRARCWLNEASRFRRQGRVEESLRILEDAVIAFEEEKAPVDLAKTYYQIGLCRLMLTDNLPEAINQFSKALELFSTHDMDLWEATSLNNLGFAYSLLGSLERADQCYRRARKCFVHHNVLAPLADNLNDNGKLNTQRGFLSLSIQQFKEAEQIHEELGMRLSAAVDAGNLGEAYGLVGRYQDALYHLERAGEFFKAANNLHRLQDSEKFIAFIWSKLGQFEEALNHLDKAAEYNELDNQESLMFSIHNQRADVLFKQQKYVKAVDFLRLALDGAAKNGLRPQEALAKRTLGEALSQTGQDREALDYLRQAHDEFTEMGMAADQALTLIALGTHYARAYKIDEAEEAFRRALQLNQESMPEIEWRVQAGLAELASIRGDLQAEISAYRRGIAALKIIRQNFWQPTLAGSYLQTPMIVFDRAIQRAAEIRLSDDVLQFMEEHKATTLIEQLKTSDVFFRDKKSQELASLRSEIGWLQKKSWVSYEDNSGVKASLELQQIRSQLVQKIRKYDSELARLERRNYSRGKRITRASTFSLSEFRIMVNDLLGKSWAALDYYLTDNQLITLVITQEQVQVYRTSITHRIRMALEMFNLNRQHSKLYPADLRVLGDFLIPTALSESLSSNTYLILAPHKKLHGIPWAAIQPSNTGKPLVASCIPVVVPSLYSFHLLLERATLEKSVSKRNTGLIVGLSSFGGRLRDLPHVKDEISSLAAKAGFEGKVLSESDATWDNLANMLFRKKRNRGKRFRTDFDWLHIASHFVVDSHSGRTSGIALWDEDVWLDQLRDLAPLPKLVTFSACNSILSFVYEGDEHVDLPSTCFLAETNTVVGSVRRILDRFASDFTESFYDNYLNGLDAANAVAITQRRMIQQAKDIESWASFVCMGIP